LAASYLRSWIGISPVHTWCLLSTGRVSSAEASADSHTDLGTYPNLDYLWNSNCGLNLAFLNSWGGPISLSGPQKINTNCTGSALSPPFLVVSSTFSSSLSSPFCPLLRVFPGCQQWACAPSVQSSQVVDIQWTKETV